MVKTALGTVETVPTNQNVGTDSSVPVSTRVWQHQFLDHVVRNTEDYRVHIEYIHNNPVKHGLCKEAGEYKWSSYRYYVNRECRHGFNRANPANTLWKTWKLKYTA